MVNYLTICLLLKTMFFLELVQQSVSAYSTLISYPCYTDEECRNEFKYNATCEDDNCVCNGSTCIKYVHTKIGESCEYNVNCGIVNSHCQNHTCVCNNGYIVSGQKMNCLKVVHSLHEPCEINVQCTVPLSVCSSRNHCECKIFHYEKDGECYEQSDLNKQCNESNNCLHIPNTKCENNICVCDNEYVKNEKRNGCLKLISNITENCEENNQCHSLGSSGICNNSNCTCAERYYLDQNLMKCLKNIEFGVDCKSHEGCRQFGGDARFECVMGKCACRRPFMEIRGECIISSAVATVITSGLIFGALLIAIFF